MTMTYSYEVIMTARGEVTVDDPDEAAQAAVDDAVDSVMLGSPHVTYDATVTVKGATLRAV